LIYLVSYAIVIVGNQIATIFHRRPTALHHMQTVDGGSSCVN